MDTYTAVKNRILSLCEEKHFTINKLATESAVSPSTLKSIFYGKSKNPGIVTLKMLCDGLGITLIEFFDDTMFQNLEQEIKWKDLVLLSGQKNEKPFKRVFPLEKLSSHARHSCFL